MHAADPPPEAQKRLIFEECSMCIKHRKYRQNWPLGGASYWPFPKTPCPAKRVASGGMIRGMFRRYVSGVCFGVCFALPC